LEANAAVKSIVRRDTGESHSAYLKRLAEAEGVDAKGAAACSAWTASARRRLRMKTGDFGILKWPSSEFCFGPPQGNERVL